MGKANSLAVRIVHWSPRLIGTIWTQVHLHGGGHGQGRDLCGRTENVIAFIGDGSMSEGEAFEGLDNAGEMNTNLIIIFNDNEMSIAPNRGGIYKGLAELRATNGASEHNLFLAFGLDYRYVADGNDVNALIDALQEVEDIDHPVVVLSAGTPGNGGFGPEQRRQADGQFVDVGIAEQHAVAEISGIAKAGGKPVYEAASTFLRRAYDQLQQDLALQGNAAAIITAGFGDAIGPGERIAAYYGSSDMKVLTYGAHKELTDREPTETLYARYRLNPEQIVQDVLEVLR